MTLRGILSLFPELAIMALGFGLLMTAGEFDLSIGSMFGLAPMVLCSLAQAGAPFWLWLGRRGRGMKVGTSR
jgi:simple sugar transport system permease protein